jgi:EAL domain-containing protein (putative c-di-GMP-specific phosphodiesterase class I)
VRAAERVQSVLAEPFTVAGRELFTSASIGIAVGRPEYGWPDEVLRDADLAMYQAKARGRARYELFTPELRAGADRRLALENDLRRAVERGELRIYYQPIVSLETGRISSAEALVRWQHPERGLIPPAEFLPIAEETGLIVSIGRWVLESACRQVRAWRAASPERQPPMSVSVNVAAAQLVLPGFADTVREALAATELPAECLKLEVTEGIISADAAAAVVTLTELARLGVALLIDDFGTGHSSLSYLHRFPISTVKIDQYFVGRMDTSDECHEIVRTIVGLAHALDMDVVAEGVETAKQLELLRALGSEYVQGYLLSRPVPAEGLEAVLLEEPVLAPAPTHGAGAGPAEWVGTLAARRV